MNTLYNNETQIKSGFNKFLQKIPNMRKTQLNFLPSLMYGMIDAESYISSDIAKCLNEEKKWAQYETY